MKYSDAKSADGVTLADHDGPLFCVRGTNVHQSDHWYMKSNHESGSFQKNRDGVKIRVYLFGGSHPIADPCEVYATKRAAYAAAAMQTQRHLERLQTELDGMGGRQ